MTTKSIPAQTTPSFVLILGEQKAPASLVPLRETAEAQGFAVTWQGKEKPILLTKEGISMEVVIGSADYVLDGDMVMQASLQAELKDGVMFVSSEIFE